MIYILSPYKLNFIVLIHAYGYIYIILLVFIFIINILNNINKQTKKKIKTFSATWQNGDSYWNLKLKICENKRLEKKKNLILKDWAHLTVKMLKSLNKNLLITSYGL